MRSFMQAKQYAKAFGAFLTAFAAFAAALASDPSIRDAFPASWIAVLAALGSAGAVAGVVAGIPNLLNEKQVVEGAAKLGLAVGGAVADTAVTAASDAAKGVIERAAQRLPAPARDAVNAAAVEVSDTVADVLRRFR